MKRSPPVVLLLVLLGGCSTGPANPSFAMPATDARQLIREMKERPRRLERPVVVLGGMNDPGVSESYLVGQLRRLTRGRKVVGVSFACFESLDSGRRRVIAAVDRALGKGDDPQWTVEVDVIGVSMGGVVARHAAAPVGEPCGRSLRIARLFTIGAPHRGAAAAGLPVLPLPFLAGVQTDLRRKSKFLRDLEARVERSPRRYPLYSYVRLGDITVGARNASPRGVHPLWVPNLPLEFPHMWAYCDPRIVADIARRLRGEPPLASELRMPLPR